MAALSWTLRTNFLPLRRWAPRSISPFLKTYQAPWRCLCTTKASPTDFSFRNDLEDVTVVDSTRGAVRVVQTLLELPLDRSVAWNIQFQKPTSKTAASREPLMSISAYAGDDVNFGNGPHLFVTDSGSHGDAEIWNLLRRYFETDECGKVWFDYSASMRALSLKSVRPTGFRGDILHMARLYGPKLRKMQIDYISKRLLTPKNLVDSYKAWEKSNLPKDGASIRIWEEQNDDPSLTPEWIAKACCDASLTHRLDERLRRVLQKTPVHGDAYQTDSGATVMRRNEDIFNLLQAYESYFQPLVDALYALELEGLSVEFSSLQQAAIKEQHTQAVLEDQFRNWASTYSSDALYMDVRSSVQLRQVLFAPCVNIHNKTATLPAERSFKGSPPKSDEKLGPESGKKDRKIVLKGAGIKAMSHTKQGWPSMSAPALREAADEYASKPSGTASPGFPAAMESVLKSMEIGRHLKRNVNLDSMVDKDGRIRLQYRTDFFTGHLLNSANGKEWEPQVRQCMSAGKGNDLIFVEYPDLEMWTLAQLSGCLSLRGRMNRPTDADSLLAHQLWLRSSPEAQSEQIPELSHEQSQEASKLDVAMRKGGDVQLVESLIGCTTERAVYLMKTWYELHPGVLKWRKEREAFINQHGFAETYMGRRRKVRRGRVAEGIGFVVNGTAAEIVMGGILRLCRDDRISTLGWRAVHADRDVIVLEGPSYSSDSLKGFIEEDVYKPVGFELDVPPRVILCHEQGGNEEMGSTHDGP